MLTKLRQSNGDLIDYTPSSAASAGDIVVLGDLVGQVPSDLAANEMGSLRIRGVINSPKLTSDNVTAGAKLYWDASNSRATTTASTHKQIGYAAAAAGTSASVVDIVLGR